MNEAIDYLKRELDVELVEDGYFYSIFQNDKYRVKLIFRDRTFIRDSYKIFINEYMIKFTRWSDLYGIVDSFKNN
jgi:hypothetical protein|nr:MAG TPA: hypothetical protein [Caudoviricetes sp.]